MSSRPAIAVALLSIAVAACGAGDDVSPTSVEVTLLPSTTSTSAPVFVPVDSGPVVDDVVPTDAPTTSPTTSTAPSDGATTSVAPAPDTTVPDSEPATTDPGTTTTDPVAEGAFTLDIDGLGSASFGAEPEGVIDFVSSYFGAPTADTGWVDPFSIGPCGGTELRQVDWGDLRLEFGDVSAVRQDRSHFYAYTYGMEESLGDVVPPGLSTPLGITVGSSVAELIEAYPTAELRSADEFIAANFFVNVNFSGRLSGLADDDVVEVIVGGVPCVG